MKKAAASVEDVDLRLRMSSMRTASPTINVIARSPRSQSLPRKVVQSISEVE